MKRIFIAAAKDESPDKIAEWRQELATLLPDAVIVDGVTDWNENFGRCGGWNGWAQDVAQGRDINGRARYDVIFCPRLCVGKATAQIVEAALQARKPVVTGLRPARRVVAITQDDPESWKTGWTLVTEGHTA